MLASEKPGKAATGKKGKKDGVDNLLTEAEKAAPMPETKVKHETPEWAKPEIRERAYTPPAPAPTVQKEKPNDGIIRVVQGAAGSSSGSAKPAVATTTTRTPPPPPGSGMRKQTAAINSRPGEWADPFSDPSPRKGAGKQVAAQAPGRRGRRVRTRAPARRKLPPAPSEARGEPRLGRGRLERPVLRQRSQDDRHAPRGPRPRASPPRPARRRGAPGGRTRSRPTPPAAQVRGRAVVAHA